MNQYLPKLDDSTAYCARCEYPLVQAPDGGACHRCWEMAKEDRKRLVSWHEKMGGRRAWDDYTTFKFEVDEYNKKGFELAKSFDPRRDNLFFYGPRGTGKSHCAAIAKRPSILVGLDVITASMPNIFDEVRAGVKSGQYSALTKDYLLKLTAAKVLNLEDIAVEKPSEFTNEFYFKLVDGRYVNKRNGLIITSNYSLEELENRWAGVDPQGRITDRLREMCKQASFRGGKSHRQQGE